MRAAAQPGAHFLGAWLEFAALGQPTPGVAASAKSLDEGEERVDLVLVLHEVAVSKARRAAKRGARPGGGKLGAVGRRADLVLKVMKKKRVDVQSWDDGQRVKVRLGVWGAADHLEGADLRRGGVQRQETTLKSAPPRRRQRRGDQGGPIDPQALLEGGDQTQTPKGVGDSPCDRARQIGQRAKRRRNAPRSREPGFGVSVTRQIQHDDGSPVLNKGVDQGAPERVVVLPAVNHQDSGALAEAPGGDGARGRWNLEILGLPERCGEPWPRPPTRGGQALDQSLRLRVEARRAI